MPPAGWSRQTLFFNIKRDRKEDNLSEGVNASRSHARFRVLHKMDSDLRALDIATHRAALPSAVRT
ncbi:hypothetical protein D3C76_676220 [compost metagenome]